MINLKLLIKSKLLNLAKVKRIHIIGCARSGTTMLHYAMLAFKNTLLHEFETSVTTHPVKSEIKELFKKDKPAFYLTKRATPWYEPEEIENLLKVAKCQDLGVINLIRDPRAVMTSFHPTMPSNGVDTEKWLSSINASETIFNELPQSAPRLNLYYEDLIHNPIKAQQQIINTFGLQLDDGITNIGELKENLLIKGLHSIDKLMLKAMHSKIRNFDKKSIEKWKLNEKDLDRVKYLLTESPIKLEITDFMKKHNYNPKG